MNLTMFIKSHFCKEDEEAQLAELLGMDERGEFNISHGMNNRSSIDNNSDNSDNASSTVNNSINKNNYSGNNREDNMQYHRYPSDKEIYRDPLKREINSSTDYMIDAGTMIVIVIFYDHIKTSEHNQE
jgi:hypothetical protein